MMELLADAAPTAAAHTDWLEKGLTLLIGALGGWISGTLKVRGQQRVAIDAQVQKIVELSMEYPYLERDSYCSAWKKDGDPNDDERARYENYCCLVFNTLEHAWELCWPWFFSKARRHAAIRKIVHVDELICRHYEWFTADDVNLKGGYSEGFYEYVVYVHTKCKRENSA